jgi:hypothetical protein
MGPAHGPNVVYNDLDLSDIRIAREIINSLTRLADLVILAQIYQDGVDRMRCTTFRPDVAGSHRSGKRQAHFSHPAEIHI